MNIYFVVNSCFRFPNAYKNSFNNFEQNIQNFQYKTNYVTLNAAWFIEPIQKNQLESLKLLFIGLSLKINTKQRMFLSVLSPSFILKKF